jgi:hypothetical protein
VKPHDPLLSGDLELVCGYRNNVFQFVSQQILVFAKKPFCPINNEIIVADMKIKGRRLAYRSDRGTRRSIIPIPSVRRALGRTARHEFPGS